MIRINSKINRSSKHTDLHAITDQMFQHLTLLGNERMAHDILTFDDFNYEPFNEKILGFKIKLESIEKDPQ